LRLFLIKSANQNLEILMPIDPAVYLTATDTTIGFVSQDSDRLDAIKGRPPHKHYITALPSLSALRARTRVPATHANRVRRARHTTFILPDGRSWRIIPHGTHHELIARLGWAYTTSANPSGRPYDEAWARTRADIVIEPLDAIAKHPSRIIRLGYTRRMRVR
jgi:tRNA A37 threonylcarbamoyladenosine synthetase subunit TsaC/SUA5/YrdC